MSSPSTPLRVLLVGALVVLLVLAATALTAQAPGGSVNLNATGPFGSCSRTAGPTTQRLLRELTCPQPGGTAAMLGITRTGQLGARTFLGGATPNAGVTMDSYASAQWSDVLHWTNTHVSQIIFTFAIKGWMFGNVNSVPGGLATAEANWLFSLLDPTGLRGMIGNGHVSRTGSFYRAIDQYLTLEVQVDDVSSLVFGSFLNLHSHTYSGTPAGIPIFAGSAGSQITTGLTRMAFYNHDWRRVSPGHYYFENGAILAADPFVTPEPISLTLVGTGLLALGALRRRRRGRDDRA